MNKLIKEILKTILQIGILLSMLYCLVYGLYYFYIENYDKANSGFILSVFNLIVYTLTDRTNK